MIAPVVREHCRLSTVAELILYYNVLSICSPGLQRMHERIVTLELAVHELCTLANLLLDNPLVDDSLVRTYDDEGVYFPGGQALHPDRTCGGCRIQVKRERESSLSSLDSLGTHSIKTLYFTWSPLTPSCMEGAYMPLRQGDWWAWDPTDILVWWVRSKCRKWVQEVSDSSVQIVSAGSQSKPGNVWINNTVCTGYTWSQLTVSLATLRAHRYL
jgi:hypothetical protein